MQKRILLLTGAPGVGKTSVLIKTVDALKAKDPLINEAKQREDAEIFIVTLANRDMIEEEITKRATAIL